MEEFSDVLKYRQPHTYCMRLIQLPEQDKPLRYGQPGYVLKSLREIPSVPYRIQINYYSSGNIRSSLEYLSVYNKKYFLDNAPSCRSTTLNNDDIVTFIKMYIDDILEVAAEKYYVDRAECGTYLARGICHEIYLGCVDHDLWDLEELYHIKYRDGPVFTQLREYYHHTGIKGALNN